MSSDLILLTGSTGHVGFRTLRCALEQGYKVRAAVRSEAKAEAVRSNPALKGVKEGQLTFTIVPDFLVDGAFDEAVKDVKYIVHVASPIPSAQFSGEDDLETALVKPAVQGTLGIFESAHKAGTVKRIVVTSSAVALVPLAALMGQELPDVFTPEARVEEVPPPYMNSVDVAYRTSKVAALNRAEAWIAKQKPSFDAIHIHPSYVLGRDDMTRTLKDFESGTNILLLQPVLGRTENPRPGSIVHVDDVALSHIRALDPKVDGNQSFFLSNNGYDGTQWNDSKKYAEKHFPDAVKKGILPNNGSVETNIVHADVSKTEKVLGIKLKSYEEMTISVVGHYLEILNKEKPEA